VLQAGINYAFTAAPVVAKYRAPPLHRKKGPSFRGFFVANRDFALHHPGPVATARPHRHRTELGQHLLGLLAEFSARVPLSGRFIWPSVAGEAVTISPAQLSYLLSGIDWRNPQETQRPTRVG
jgi:hypothetical protein